MASVLLAYHAIMPKLLPAIGKCGQEKSEKNPTQHSIADLPPDLLASMATPCWRLPRRAQRYIAVGSGSFMEWFGRPLGGRGYPGCRLVRAYDQRADDHRPARLCLRPIPGSGGGPR